MKNNINHNLEKELNLSNRFQKERITILKNKLGLVLLQTLVYIGMFLIFYFYLVFLNFEFSLPMIDNLSGQELIQKLKNKEYLDQKIEVILQEEQISLIIEGVNYKTKTIQKWLVFFFSCFLFLMLFFIHRRIDTSISIFRMILNYSVILSFAFLVFFGVEKMLINTHIDITKLSQKELHKFHNKLYVNEKHKNLYQLIKAKG
jgi:hypothetical protein